MARIRSIKPEFWTDGSILRLSDSTALFFIAIWNFADDFGFFPLDSLELSMKTARWRSQDMMKMCRALEERGMIRCSRGDGVGMIIGWEHQRINDRRASKWNQTEIKWDDPKNDAGGSEKKSLGEDRIGKDRRGRDRISAPAVKPAKAPDEKTLGSKLFDHYRILFLKKYNVEPNRNADVNRWCKQLGQKLGEDAFGVLEFYLNHNDYWYVKHVHSLKWCLQNAEELHTQWQRGIAVTGSQARTLEKTIENKTNADAAIDFFLNQEA